MAWAPPVVVPAGPAAGVEYAGVLPRFVAWLLDNIILFVIGLVITVPALLIAVGSIDWSAIANGPVRSTSTDYFTGGVFIALLVAALLGEAVRLAYFGLQWASGARATLGMRVLKLQVANAADGRTITRTQAVKRWVVMGSLLSLLGFVPVIGLFSGWLELAWNLVLLITTGVSPTKQGVHDKVADTVVVQPPGGSGNAAAMGCVIIVVIVALIFILPIVALIFLGGQISGILDEVGRSV